MSTTTFPDGDVRKRLLDIKKGESVIYHIGKDLDDAGSIGDLAREQQRKGRVALVQRRVGPPTHLGSVDWVGGVGEFEYIAQGLSGGNGTR